MKKVMLWILILCLILTTGCTEKGSRGKTGLDIPEEISSLSDEEYFSKEFTPVLRFVVASDLHIKEAGTELEQERTEEMFQVAYDYAESQSDYTNLDAVIICGDFTDNGTLNSFNKVSRLLNSLVREGTELRVLLGNHDYYSSPDDTEIFLNLAFGYESANSHLTINGFHFLLASPDVGGDNYSSETQQWLSTEIAAASDDDPTGCKPIFVFQHQHVKNTVYGSDRWGVEDLREILNQYPQAVDFSGHSHFPINDPTSVWQGEFTALGTATLSYGEYGISGLYPDSVWPTDSEGGYTRTAPWENGGEKIRDLAQFYIVEVDANYAIRILGYDLNSDGWAMDPLYFRQVGDTSKFTYTDDRVETSEKPTFGADASIELVRVENGELELSFPQAQCSDVVQHYACTINDDVNTTLYRLSDTMYIPAPETLKVTFENLEVGKTYTVSIIPVNAFGVEGEPLTAQFTAQ